MIASIHVESLFHRYGERVALAGVSFDVGQARIFAVLGPNGGGKTTLFRILCTSMRPTGGRAAVCGRDVAAEPAHVRRLIGVVFQHPSLDAKLTVRENLRNQGHLYGLSGRMLADRVAEMLRRFGLEDRADHRVETLSGGLARRADLAKGLLHRPRVLLLDEPSTGLDPQARWNLWQYLDRCRQEEQLTVLMTTHFMDEADRCDTVGIVDSGRLVTVGSPDELKREIAGDCIHIESDAPEDLAGRIAGALSVPAAVIDRHVRIEHAQAPTLVPRLMELFGPQIRSISLGRPTLEEVFIRRTGHGFEPEVGDARNDD